MDRVSPGGRFAPEIMLGFSSKEDWPRMDP